MSRESERPETSVADGKPREAAGAETEDEDEQTDHQNGPKEKSPLY